MPVLQSKPLDPVTIAGVTLTVHNLDQVSAFYEAAVGLTQLSGDATEHVLGVAGQPLLRLQYDRHARRADRHAAGLFHTAFLLPTRAELASWARYTLSQSRTRVTAASDHTVSEAIYLRDPEGNGIEVYADRPREQWTWVGDQIWMNTEALDIEDLLAAAGAPWRQAPAETRIGHAHLQVGNIAAAEAYYRNTLGFAITQRSFGATFYSTGGYHHQIATNIWNSRNAEPREEPMTGLSEVTLLAAESSVLGERDGPSFARDPWGINFRIVRGTFA
jgi:catechol 2,3-dioxygenase